MEVTYKNSLVFTPPYIDIFFPTCLSKNYFGSFAGFWFLSGLGKAVWRRNTLSFYWIRWAACREARNHRGPSSTQSNTGVLPLSHGAHGGSVGSLVWWPIYCGIKHRLTYQRPQQTVNMILLWLCLLRFKFTFSEMSGPEQQHLWPWTLQKSDLKYFEISVFYLRTKLGDSFRIFTSGKVMASGNWKIASASWWSHWVELRILH